MFTGIVEGQATVSFAKRWGSGEFDGLTITVTGLPDAMEGIKQGDSLSIDGSYTKSHDL
jgi:riboflavin synthase alpha subunit